MDTKSKYIAIRSAKLKFNFTHIIVAVDLLNNDYTVFVYNKDTNTLVETRHWWFVTNGMTDDINCYIYQFRLPDVMPWGTEDRYFIKKFGIPSDDAATLDVGMFEEWKSGKTIRLLSEQEHYYLNKQRK